MTMSINNLKATPVDGPGAWTGADLAQDASWRYGLEPRHLVELENVLAGIRRRGLEFAEVCRSDMPLPSLTTMLAAITDDLRDGRGFAVLQGFPVDQFPIEDLEILYWGLCTHLGTGMTQNSDGGLIHYVTEGKRRPSQGRRGVGFPRRTPLHVDLMDVVSLLCVRQAPDDPPSWLGSSLTVYNWFLRERPEDLARLYEGFAWDRMDEHGEGEAPASPYRVPVFSRINDTVSCRYNRNWMTNAAQRTGAPFTEKETALLNAFDDTAHANRLAFPFGPGDIQFCNNYTVLHGRDAHQTETENTRQRLLMRIWLDIPNFRQFADESIVRYGIGRHGRLGWSAYDRAAGKTERPRPRRDDGAPLITINAAAVAD